MSFDKDTRNLLAKTVATCRRRLTEDVTDQLRGIFGLHPDGTILSLEKMTHLSPDQAAAARQLRDLLDHYTAGEAGEEKDRRRAAYERIVQEISFTILNRLAALRMCEERDLVAECVRKGTASDGFRIFERVSGGALGARYDSYRVFLECLFDELALDLGVLFDRSTPQSAIFPTELCMEDVLAEMNKPELAHLWSEDETIGWVYQYFNPPEERKAMRDASQAPRNSRELAVRNQFFTPRYVVEFLTDNTLGRIWYEMRKGETRLKVECEYLVYRKHSFFLDPAEEPQKPFPGSPPYECDPDMRGEMWVRPNPELEDFDYSWMTYALTVGGYEYAREHLGVECGDFANERLGKYRSTKKWEGTFEELRCCLFFEQRRYHHFGEGPSGEDLEAIKDIYEAICDRWDIETEYIPHRPKKDPRDLKILDPACGSGHFLLYAFDLLETIYLEAWEDADSPPSEATGKTLRDDYETIEELSHTLPGLVLRHNLYGIDIDPRAVQIATLALWLRAQRAYQAIGLKPQDRPRITKTSLVCAEPMPGEKDMLQEFTSNLRPTVLGQLVEVVFEKMKLAGEAGSLLKIEEEIQQSVESAKNQWVAESKQEQKALFPELEEKKPAQGELFDVSDITDEKFWDQAEDRILQALKDYSEQAENGQVNRRRLFAEDAAQGFAFIDLCRKRYDVVLMNPPFGDCPSGAFDYLSREIPYWCKNLASAFVGRLITMLNSAARIGMVTDRTILIKSSYEDFRTKYALGSLNIGPLVDLGWDVLDANVEISAVVYSESNQNSQLFIDCRNESDKDGLLSAIVTSEIHEKGVWLESSSFLRLPNAAIAHDMPRFVIRWFNVFPSLRQSGAKALQGHAIKMDWYGRLRWEIEPSLIGNNTTWSCMYNGGSFSRFYLPLVEVVRWNETGTFLKNHPSTRWSNAKYQQRCGVGYGKRGEILDAHIVPTGHVFTVEGLFVYPDSGPDIWYYLGILNAPLCSVILNYYCGQHKHAGYLDLLPTPRPDLNDPDKRRVSESAFQGWSIMRDIDKYNEVSPLFLYPCQSRSIKSSGLTETASRLFSSTKDAIVEETIKLESAVEKVYDLGVSDRMQIIDSIERATYTSAYADDLASGDGLLSLFGYAHNLLSYTVGAAFLRWDVRIAQDTSLAPELPDPFDPLPACPPGMLVGQDGLPAKPGGIVSEEWLRTRPNAITLPLSTPT